MRMWVELHGTWFLEIAQCQLVSLLFIYMIPSDCKITMFVMYDTVCRR